MFPPRYSSILILATSLGAISTSAHAQSSGSDNANSADPIVLPAAQIDAPAYWLRKATQQYLEQTALPPSDAKTAGSISQWDSALTLIALGELRVGDADGARQTLTLLNARANSLPEHSALRATAFIELANLEFHLGDTGAYNDALAQAKKASDSMEDVFLRPAIELRLATLQDRAGDASAADDIARMTRDLARKTSIYCALAIQAFEREDHPDVERRLARAAAAAEGQDDETASPIYAHVARTYAEIGSFDAARVTAEKIEDPALKADVYGSLAKRQMKAKDARGYNDSIAKARAAIATLPDTDRSWRYDLLGYDQLACDDRTGQRLTLELSHQAAMALTEPDSRAKALCDLAAAYAHCGNVAACQKALSDAQAQCADSAKPFHPAISDMACALARAGRIEAAGQMIQQIPTGEPRSTALTALAEACADANDLDAASDLLAQLTEPQLRMRVCRRMAESHTRRGNFEDLSRWLRTLKSPVDRTYACLGAAEGMLDRRVLELSNADLSEFIDP